MFVSDGRSQKVEDAEVHPLAEACWYFTETREQFRLSGHLSWIDADHPNADLKTQRQQVWENLSDKSRLQFYWPHPGQKRTEGSERFEDPEPNPQLPPISFCLGLLIPQSVDHLELKGNPQNRTHYSRVDDAQWNQVELNP